MPADPLRVMVVRNPHDTPDTRDLLAQIDNLDRGVLVVRPVPGTASPAVLALALLAALGKQVEPRPREPQHQWWRLARAWTAGHQVNHLVVDRAHTLPGKLIRDLIGLADTAGAAGVWFIDASPKRIAPVLAGLDAVTERPRQLLNLTLVEPDKPPTHHDHGRHFPPVLLPHTGFLYFRHACQQQLAVTDAALVGFAWEHAYETMEQWLRRLDLFAYDRPTDGQLITEVPRLTPMLSAHLASTLYTARHPGEALVRLRAIQAALFRVGLLLHHEPRLAVVPGDGLRCPLTPDTAATINRSVSTAAAAAAVLQLVYPDGARHPIIPPPARRLAHVHPDGSHLHTEHGPIPVPACGHALLRAHLHWRNPTGGTDPDAALFDEHRHSVDHLAQQALRPLNLRDPIDVGYRRSRAYLRGHATTWMWKRGLELSAIAELAPRTGTQ